MDVEVGSNLYRNTDGTIEIEGDPADSDGPETDDGRVTRELCLVRSQRENDGKARR